MCPLNARGQPSAARLRRVTQLKRELGFSDAVLLGLGSVIGTGIYVSLAYAAGIGGPLVILAIAAAALVATLSALSSAQLAAAHPVSGGTYEYGYRYLAPWLGFSAGWMFLCAKTASAATAALGVAAYLLQLTAIGSATFPPQAVAPVTVLFVTAVAVAGLRLSARLNASLVALAIAGLTAFVYAAAPSVIEYGSRNLFDYGGTAAATGPMQALLQSIALLFVAFTGYARVATLGEEVREPRRTIPRAIIATLWISAALYLLVAVAAVGALGAGRFAELLGHASAPLELAAQALDHGIPARLIAIGALAAMLGVLLNLLLGLSRVLLAMGRRGDLPGVLAHVDSAGKPGALAVILPGLAIAAIATFGSVKAAWSFSAFSVLIYYSITNLAALRLPRERRLFDPAVAVCGLTSCLGLAWFLDWRVVLSGLGLLLLGLGWHWLRRHQLSQSSL
jgi:basic amino acid/polyamine antiporter, APA family